MDKLIELQNKALAATRDGEYNAGLAKAAEIIRSQRDGGSLTQLSPKLRESFTIFMTNLADLIERGGK